MPGQIRGEEGEKTRCACEEVSRQSRYACEKKDRGIAALHKKKKKKKNQA
jgi:hypothetical protein